MITGINVTSNVFGFLLRLTVKFLIIEKIKTVSRITSCSVLTVIIWETGDPAANLFTAVHSITRMK